MRLIDIVKAQPKYDDFYKVVDKSADILAMFKSGMMPIEISRKFGCSRERIRQILLFKFGVKVSDFDFRKKRAKIRAERRLKKMDERCLKLFGCTFNEHKELVKHKGNPTRVFSELKRNTRFMGVPMKMNLFEWWTLWKESGHWAEHGVHKGAYAMVRIDKDKPFEKNNVHIVSLQEVMSKRTPRKKVKFWYINNKHWYRYTNKKGIRVERRIYSKQLYVMGKYIKTFKTIEECMEKAREILGDKFTE